MTVLVDELRVWPHARHACFRNGSAHLTADTLEELHAFAARLGLRRSWFQADDRHPHYDLAPSKHSFALELGAMFVPAREQAARRLGLALCASCGVPFRLLPDRRCLDCDDTHATMCARCVSTGHLLEHA